MEDSDVDNLETNPFREQIDVSKMTFSARGPNFNTNRNYRSNCSTSTMMDSQPFVRQMNRPPSYCRGLDNDMSISRRSALAKPHTREKEYQNSAMNGYCSASMSMCSTFSNATDIAYAIKNGNFSEYDLKVIKKAICKHMDRARYRNRINKRRKMKVYMKTNRRKSKDDSGDEASDSSNSSDCHSVRTSRTAYTNFRRHRRMSNRSVIEMPLRTNSELLRRTVTNSELYRDCTDNMRYNCLKSMIPDNSNNYRTYNLQDKDCLRKPTKILANKTSIPEIYAQRDQQSNTSNADSSSIQRQNINKRDMQMDKSKNNSLHTNFTTTLKSRFENVQNNPRESLETDNVGNDKQGSFTQKERFSRKGFLLPCHRFKKGTELNKEDISVQRQSVIDYTKLANRSKEKKETHETGLSIINSYKKLASKNVSGKSSDNSLKNDFDFAVPQLISRSTDHSQVNKNYKLSKNSEMDQNKTMGLDMNCTELSLKASSMKRNLLFQKTHAFDKVNLSSRDYTKDLNIKMHNNISNPNSTTNQLLRKESLITNKKHTRTESNSPKDDWEVSSVILNDAKEMSPTFTDDEVIDITVHENTSSNNIDMRKSCVIKMNKCIINDKDHRCQIFEKQLPSDNETNKKQVQTTSHNSGDKRSITSIVSKCKGEDKSKTRVKSLWDTDVETDIENSNPGGSQQKRIKTAPHIEHTTLQNRSCDNSMLQRQPLLGIANNNKNQQSNKIRKAKVVDTKNVSKMESSTSIEDKQFKGKNLVVAKSSKMNNHYSKFNKMKEFIMKSKTKHQETENTKPASPALKERKHTYNALKKKNIIKSNYSNQKISRNTGEVRKDKANEPNIDNPKQYKMKFDINTSDNSKSDLSNIVSTEKKRDNAKENKSLKSKSLDLEPNAARNKELKNETLLSNGNSSKCNMTLRPRLHRSVNMDSSMVSVSSVSSQDMTLRSGRILSNSSNKKGTKYVEGSISAFFNDST